MKHIGHRLIAVFALVLVFGALAVAAAQDALPPLSDAAQHPAALAAYVAVVISFARKHLVPSLDGPLVIIASLVVGAIMGGLLSFITPTLQLLPGIMLGLSAGFLASGGKDFLTDVFGGGTAKAPTAPGAGTLPRG